MSKFKHKMLFFIISNYDIVLSKSKGGNISMVVVFPLLFLYPNVRCIKEIKEKYFTPNIYLKKKK